MAVSTVIFSQYSPVCDFGAWECSGCELLWVFTDNKKPSEHKMNYCPQCGRFISKEVPWKEKKEEE